MKIVLILVSFLGLALTIVPSLLVFNQEITLETHKQYMLLGMVLWFISAPFWMEKEKL